MDSRAGYRAVAMSVSGQLWATRGPVRVAGFRPRADIRLTATIGLDFLG